jgi:hypothetical protein
MHRSIRTQREKKVAVNIIMSGFWKLLRAPLLCCIGLTCEAYLVWQLFHSAIWMEIVMPQQEQHERQSSFLPPLLLLVAGSSLVTTLIFCCGCTMLWWYDLYHVYVVESSTIRTIVRAALTYSLDDFLALLCDPTRLVTWVAGGWLIPTTLYGLPHTTAVQRSRVLRSSGLIVPTVDDPDGETVLLQPGGWLTLLPKMLQTTIHDIVTREKQQDDDTVADSSSPLLLPSNKSMIIHKGAAPDMVDVSLERALSGDDEDDAEEYYFPYSVSPIYTSSMNAHDDKELRSTEEVESKESEMPTLRRKAQDDRTTPLQSVENELYQVFSSSIRTMLREKVGNVFGPDLQDRQWPMLAVAISCTGLFWLQQRHSATARSLLNHIVQLVFMAGTSSVATASILLAIVIPLLLREEQQTSPRPLSQPSHNKSLFLHNLWSLASSVGLARPAAIPRSLVTDLATKIRIPWRGTIAALVLFYFRRRYVKNHHHQRKSVAMPNRFS